mgnify:CR=1 FL=1
MDMMPKLFSKRKGEENKLGQLGFSLIEVLVSVFVIAIGSLLSAAMVLNGARINSSSYMRQTAQQYAYDIIDKINNTNQPIIFFYVGKEMDCDRKSDVIGYLLENGIEENRIDGIHFIEKDYGFIRTWMDAGVSHDTIVKTIKYMKKNQIL